jgi:S-formylglutathione hydrolase FrmB
VRFERATVEGTSRGKNPIWRRCRRRGLAALLAAAAAAGAIEFAVTAPATAADNASPVCTRRSTPIPQDPATFVSQTAVAGTDGRLQDVVLNSPALSGQTHVYVLLPKGYDASGATRYPVLYLLHGAAGSYSDWYTQGNVIGIVDQVSAADHLPPFITVMPDGGTWGFYSDWYGRNVSDTSPAPPPAWTQYHIGELVPWIDGHYPTIANRDSRAVAGLSMGGFGAMSYASRFPDLFSTAASFSGAVNPDYSYPAGPTLPEGQAGLTAVSTTYGGGQPEACVWGDFATQQVHWEGDDPTYLAGSLASTSLYIASGGGDQNNPSGLAPTDPIEESVYMMSTAFVAALDADHIKHTDNFYGAGTHSWSYWQTDLQNYLPLMAAAWANPLPAPPAVPFSYDSIMPSFEQWGWSFTTHREVTEFTYLRNVSQAGLQVIGSGTLDVVSAPLYVPGATYSVKQGSNAQLVKADSAGRLSFSVDLGPSHTSQQQSFDPAATSSWPHASVAIEAVQ